jgi:hypothetical protein
VNLLFVETGHRLAAVINPPESRAHQRKQEPSFVILLFEKRIDEAFVTPVIDAKGDRRINAHKHCINKSMIRISKSFGNVVFQGDWVEPIRTIVDDGWNLSTIIGTLDCSIESLCCMNFVISLLSKKIERLPQIL